MDERTEVLLGRLRDQVQNAKSVPMSASCMLNRKETLRLIDQTMEALRQDVSESRRVTENSLATLERAQSEAQLIIKAAEERAAYLAGQTEVMVQARARAAQLQAQSLDESEALKRETDAYIDQRIAGFEAALQKTMSQVQTMRARLADRSNLDANDTQALPRLAI
ncbi:MAG: hypothetical protein LBR32_08050 [Propionibacteriaceae bacterium]|jgi:hypothetical protein|nr:hypothetical protein [Propionibacteriaceae bacterium]